MDILNLLIVDDEEEDLELMASILLKEGYNVITAKSGKEALKIIAIQEIHIVLLDILMPVMTGYKACKEIRRRFKERPIQIVLVSGLTVDHYLEKAIEVGGDDFIYKPLNILDLQRRVKAASIRFKSQYRLFVEKESLKQRVVEKEKLSSKVINENQNLIKENEELKGSNEELMIIASHDMLSGLYNRMRLYSKIDIEIARSARSNAPLTGIMVDVDHFKLVNDNYGHQVGDTVIHELGKRIKSCMRVYDFASRYGGEEFFLVLTDATLQQGYLIGERFRKRIENHCIQCNDLKLKITVSMGVAQYKAGETKESWIERADMAMYLAKQQGRNRIITEEQIGNQAK